MNLKKKIAISFSIAFSVLFGIAMLIIYYASFDFRKDQFRQRLIDKLDNISHYIASNPYFNRQSYKNYFHDDEDGLFYEDVIILDKNKQLVFSTVKDQTITWNASIVNRLNQEKQIFYYQDQYETLAKYYRINGLPYYIIVKAQDYSGNEKMDHLALVLTILFVLSAVLVWIFSYNLIQRLLIPLDKLKDNITQINASKLTKPVEYTGKTDEIAVLTRAFNTMLLRLSAAFESQKEFNSSASHELRTPLARMSFQLENLYHQNQLSEEVRQVLRNISKETLHLSEVTDSLMLLSKFDSERLKMTYAEERIDEIIFTAYEKVAKVFPDLQLDFSIGGIEDPKLSIFCSAQLIEIAFVNLFKNAALYSDTKEVKVMIVESTWELKVLVSNTGPALSTIDQKRIFDAFSRGENASETTGSGLGLRIVQRIMQSHQATIAYQADLKQSTHTFVLLFKLFPNREV
ncbi:HAMP domain-containing sensor histidine kinase [Sphingobacterium multivorum]|jgi:signal transduction histidine kinase|uniref:histidine kinase n=1 Tax=Sphingobacterium multivorum TaxID=28454 RepID=A0A2X2JJD8_SPHMU|nr:HAMP domain-containing sensor histidine kinase [Sphingobacterium multivorum]QQT60007.1 HAMP domain-containing histidine kinase [Sphingobacterium multivorum]QRQ60251.1 HAMP domain-containing histidine kinase [Sphingobacterium multivorum]SPZ91833.1 Signal transduction histidine-protein kinase ArlS [Sphingobacterium multivorum]